MGNAIRSPLAAIGVLLVALEGIAGGSLFALGSDPGLRIALVTMMVVVLATVTATILGVIIYLTLTKPAYLFSPGEIGQLHPNAQSQFISGQRIPLEPINRLSREENQSISPS